MNKLLRNILMLVALVTVVSCEYDDTFDYPTVNDPVSNYKYTSNSIYYKTSGKVSKELSSEGYIEYTDYSGSATLYITPSIGWGYQIHLSNFEELSIGNGNVVTVFSIGTQQENINDASFSIIGTDNIEVLNADGNSLGLYDGYIQGTKIFFEYKSTNLEEQSWVVSKLEGTTIN